jgi:hypothetical protein
MRPLRILAILIFAQMVGCSGNGAQSLMHPSAFGSGSVLSCANSSGGVLPAGTVCDSWTGATCSGTSADCPSPLVHAGERLYSPTAVCQ